MITADALRMMTAHGPLGITTMIRRAGYKNDSFTGAKFLGLTNGGQFCYLCTYKTDDGGTDSCKVFLTYKSDTDIRAEY